MDFEELQVIWDAQNREPLFALNEAGLRASVRRKDRAFRRRIFWRDVREIGIGLGAGAGMFLFGWALFTWDAQHWRRLLGPDAEVSRWDALLMLTASGLFLLYALFHYVGRKRQERRERQFESSLRGDLERTLAQTEYQIRLAQSVVWWGLIPLAVASCLLVYVMATIVPTPPAVWLLVPAIMIPAFVLDFRCKRHPIKTQLLPFKRELEALRRTLTEPERSL